MALSGLLTAISGQIMLEPLGRPLVWQKPLGWPRTLERHLAQEPLERPLDWATSILSAWTLRRADA